MTRERRPLRPDAEPTPLGRVVASEARRVLSESALQPDPTLIAAGWTHRFVADRVRAQEAVRLYRELGFEVRTEAVIVSEAAEGCADCQIRSLLDIQMIYTRKAGADPVRPEE